MAFGVPPESRLQALARTYVWPLWRDHPLVVLMSAWLVFIVGTIGSILFVDANLVILFTAAGVFLLAYVSFFYSSSCHERFERNELEKADT